MNLLIATVAALLVGYVLISLVLDGARFTMRERLRLFVGGFASELGSLTLSTADAVLKDDYTGSVVDQLNNASLIMSQVYTNTEDFIGRRWVAALRVGRNHGVGNRAENVALPEPGEQGYDNTFGPIRSSYAAIQLTGQAIESMKKSKGAFIRALEPEMEGATMDAQRDYARQLLGTSNGVIATSGVTTASTTIVLDATTGSHQLLHLSEGFLIDILDVSAGNALLTPAGGVKARVVNDEVSPPTFVIELPSGANATAITTAQGDLIVAHSAFGVSDNSGNPGDGQIELTGLQTMVDDTATLHTLSPAVEPRWKSRVYRNGGVKRAISENLVTKGIMDTESRSGKIIELLVGSGGVFRAYSNLLSSLKRFTEDIELKGGYSAVSVSAVKSGRQGSTKLALAWDRDCPDSQLFGLSTSSFVKRELSGWEWMDKDGAVLERITDSSGRKDAYGATMRAYTEWSNTQRNANFRIVDITES